ncbi:MAG: hypothetical protein ACRD2O_10255, partial [Terriglobia bacterium]
MPLRPAQARFVIKILINIHPGAGSFVPHVVVRNLLGQPQSVTITVEYPQPPSSPDSSAPA